jgi:trimethylamine:corrinoid methyltransferase-like protein
VPLMGLVGAETGLPGIASAGARIGGAMAARRLPEAMVKNSINRARQTILTIAGDRETRMNILEREYGG